MNRKYTKKSVSGSNLLCPPSQTCPNKTISLVHQNRANTRHGIKACNNAVCTRLLVGRDDQERFAWRTVDDACVLTSM